MAAAHRGRVRDDGAAAPRLPGPSAGIHPRDPGRVGQVLTAAFQGVEMAGADGKAAGLAEPMEMAATADAILGTLLLAFDGPELAATAAARLRDAPSAGISLFRYANVRTAEQT